MPPTTDQQRARAIIDELDRRDEPPTATGIRNRVYQALKGTRRASRAERERAMIDAITTHYRSRDQRQPWKAPAAAAAPAAVPDDRRRARELAQKADAAARAERAAAAEYRAHARTQTDPEQRKYYEQHAAQRITNAKRAATIAAAARRRTFTHPSDYDETVNPDPSHNDDPPGTRSGSGSGAGPASIIDNVVDLGAVRMARQAAAEERKRSGRGADEERKGRRHEDGTARS